MSRVELLIGCGSRRDKIMATDSKRQWDGLITLDYNEQHNPNIVHDLCDPKGLPFEDDSVDEIHAYEVLEHTGSQGDYKFFFWQFSDFWRVLKPNGILFATVPSMTSIWAWGDPSHTRVLPPATLAFLSQPVYTNEIGKSPMSDFRFIYTADFDILMINDDKDTVRFALKAIKPSRITP